MFIPTPISLLREALLHKDYSITLQPLSIARKSFIQLSELGRRGENGNVQASKQQQRGFELRLSRLYHRATTTWWDVEHWFRATAFTTGEIRRITHNDRLSSYVKKRGENQGLKYLKKREKTRTSNIKKNGEKTGPQIKKKRGKSRKTRKKAGIKRQVCDTLKFVAILKCESFFNFAALSILKSSDICLVLMFVAKFAE